MKNLLIILICFSLSSCFVSKEIRQKQRCNKKLEKILAKCPELLKIDSVLVPFEVIIPKIEIKDSLTIRVDTLEILKYVEVSKIKNVIKSISLDTTDFNSKYQLIISLRNGILNYKIVILQDTIKSVLNVPKMIINPIQLTTWERIQLLFGKWLFLAFAIFIIICIYFIGKLINKYF